MLSTYGHEKRRRKQKKKNSFQTFRMRFAFIRRECCRQDIQRGKARTRRLPTQDGASHAGASRIYQLILFTLLSFDMYVFF